MAKKTPASITDDTDKYLWDLPAGYVEGYRRATLADPMITAVCLKCGASVADSALDIHTTWHQNDGTWGRVTGER